MMVGRLLSFWDGVFLGAFWLVSGVVICWDFQKNSPKRMEVVIPFVVTSFNSHSLGLRGRAKIQGVPKNDVESTWSKVATGKNAIKGVAIKILLMATRNPAFKLRLVVYPIIYRVFYIPGGSPDF